MPTINRVKNKMDGAVDKYNAVQNDIRLQYNAKVIVCAAADFDGVFDEFLIEMKIRRK